MNYITIQIPTRPYLQKYVTTVEGPEITVNNDSFIWPFLSICLRKKTDCRLSGRNKKKRMASFSATLQCKIPISQIYGIGMQLTSDDIIIINRFLENIFRKELANFCRNYVDPDVRYSGYQKAYEAFAEQYGISIDEDIAYDTLKKMEYRHRKKHLHKTSPHFSTP